MAVAELERSLRRNTREKITKDCKEADNKLVDKYARLAEDQDAPPGHKDYYVGWVRRYNAMCNQPSTENIRKWLWYSLEKETKTCNITQKQWTETFTKSGFMDKWVTDQGPSRGHCPVVVVSILERKPVVFSLPEQEPITFHSWTYETQTFVINTDSLVCAMMVEPKTRYSTDSNKHPGFERSCEFVNFFGYYPQGIGPGHPASNHLPR